MADVLLIYAHPGHRFSHANARMFEAARGVAGITVLDLYATYPRYDVVIDAEQARLRAHDVIVLQHPLFWYSTPALVKEWIDLTFEHGFAYGAGGDALAGKTLMQAVTTAGPEDAYSETGYQNFELRTFLTPIEQTARLSKMAYAAPYVLHSALKAAGTPEIDAHVAGYVRLLEALRDDRVDRDRLIGPGILRHDTLPILAEAGQ